MKTFIATMGAIAAAALIGSKAGATTEPSVPKAAKGSNEARSAAQARPDASAKAYSLASPEGRAIHQRILHMQRMQSQMGAMAPSGPIGGPFRRRLQNEAPKK